MITTYIRTRLARLDVRDLHTLTLDILGYGLMLVLALAMLTTSFFWTGRSVHSHAATCAPLSSQEPAPSQKPAATRPSP